MFHSTARVIWGLNFGLVSTSEILKKPRNKPRSLAVHKASGFTTILERLLTPNSFKLMCTWFWFNYGFNNDPVKKISGMSRPDLPWCFISIFLQFPHEDNLSVMFLFYWSYPGLAVNTFPGPSDLVPHKVNNQFVPQGFNIFHQYIHIWGI